MTRAVSELQYSFYFLGGFMRYRVIVGNIGEVCSTDGRNEAVKTYGIYKRDSMSGYGRGSGESVTLFDGDDILYEYIGVLDT